MQAAEWLTILNILVAFLGVLFVVFTLFEWKSLRKIKKDFAGMEARLRKENHRAMKAAHRVISSYALTDIPKRIALLQSVVSEYPSAFNGFNALGYAFLENGETAKAIDAFRQAVQQHPEDKAGYCDLAAAYLKDGQEELALKYFRKAVAVDPTAKKDIMADPGLTDILEKLR